MILEKYRKNRITGPEYISRARAEGHDVAIGNLDLPVAQHFAEIRESLRNHQVLVLVSETGSGKSTQVPQLAYELGYTVDQTQPTRSSAHELGRRIGQELRDSIPGLPSGIVGTHTGVECTVQPETDIKVMTAGTWLAVNYNSETNRLKQPPRPHLVMHDEVHLMGVETEIAIALSLAELRRNPDLRLVLSTATPNIEAFTTRIEEITGIVPDVVEIPGRQFKIDIEERPDLTPVTAINEYSEDGYATLVFQRGLGEIKDTIRAIKRTLPHDHKVKIFAAHSSLPHAQNSAAFNYQPAPDEKKIVVGTNILETGLTVAGTKYIVDDGTARRKTLNKHGYTELVIADISQSSADQRAGRAGRLCNGVAVRVKPEGRYSFVSYEEREKHETPEILRSDLRDVVLELAVIGIDLADFATITNLSPLSIIRAKESLRIVGALDDDGCVTPIGIEMNKYPVRPMLQRAIVESQRHDQTIQRYVSAMAAAVESGGLPMHTRYASKGWRDVSDEAASDLLCQLDLFIHARGLPAKEQIGLGLDPRNIEEAERAYGKCLYHLDVDDHGLVPPTEAQRQVIIECIYTGYVENVFRRIGRDAYRMVEGPEDIIYSLSDRSVVDERVADMVVGMPYAIERTRRGKQVKVHVIESVTHVPTINALGVAAARLAIWSEEQVAWRNGRAFVHTDQSIRGISTGKRNEHMGDEQDMETYRQAVLNQVLAEPGQAQLQLRLIKKELEALAHLSHDKIPRMTQEELIELVQEAITRTDVMDTHHVDNSLMLLMQEYDLSIRSYVSEADERFIRDNAPSELHVAGQILPVEYRNGVPKIKHPPEELILSLTQNVYLPDGREVRFVHGKREYGALDLKQLLSVESTGNT